VSGESTHPNALSAGAVVGAVAGAVAGAEPIVLVLHLPLMLSL